MKPQDKLNLLKPLVLKHFLVSKDINKICAALINENILDKGIGFTEIAPLTRNILKSEGLVVPLAERKEKYSISVQGIELPTNYKEYIELIAEETEENDLPKSFIKKKIDAQYMLNEIPLPKKSTMIGWRLKMAQCFIENPEITREELLACMQNDDVVKTPEHYVRDFYTFARAIATQTIE